MKNNYKIDKLVLELSSNEENCSCSIKEPTEPSSPTVIKEDNLYPKSLEVTKEKTVYNQDDELNFDDLQVKCIYTDGSSEIIQHYTTNADEIDMGFAGYKQLKVYYTHNGITAFGKVGINVQNTDSYNNIQLAYRVAKSGILKSGTPVVTATDKLIQYGKFKMRIKGKITIEQNYNSKKTVVGFGHSGVWGGDTLGNRIVLNPYQTGEFHINTNINIDFKRKNVAVDAEILRIFNNGGTKVQGVFELEDVSLAYTEQVAAVPVSLKASKVMNKAVIGEDLITDDITATVTYNTETTKQVTPTLTVPEDLTVGNNNITVSYSENDHTVTTTINMRYYAKDKTEPDEFHDLTATEWCKAWTHGINWGNALDSKAANEKNPLMGDTTHKGDSYVDTQETSWGQPVATLKNFQDIKAQGFDMVRIPVTWCYNSYTEPELNADGLTTRHIGKFWACRVREVVDMALEAGLYVLINMHHEQPIIFTGSTYTKMKQVYKDAADCWTEIAEKFKHYNEKLAFEGYNEVDNLKSSFNFNAEAAEQMNKLNQIFVDCVRKTGSNNAKRVLHCPTTVHIATEQAVEAWECPKDTIENHIVCNVHSYSQNFVQNLNNVFLPLETWSDKVRIPVCIGEWGTKTSDGTYDFRARHAQNYTARAKYHHLYPVFWDNGSDYELIKKYNRTHEYNHPEEGLQGIIDGLKKGYDEMKAYALPKNMVLTLNKPEDFEYNMWSEAQGYHWTGWGYCVSHAIPVQGKKKCILNIVRSGEAIAQMVVMHGLYWLKTITLENGTKEYKLVNSESFAYHQTGFIGEVPEDADSCIISINSSEKNVSEDAFKTMLNNHELSVEFMIYEDSDIYEAQLEYRKPTQLLLSKDRTVYGQLNDTLNTDDLHVSVQYDDDYVKDLRSNEFTFDTSQVDMSKEGHYYINVQATVDGVTLNKGVEIKVGAIAVDLDVVPTEMLIHVNNPDIDTSEFLVSVINGDGTTVDLLDDEYSIDTSQINTNVIGTYDVTVSYRDAWGFITTHVIPCIVYDKLECKGFKTMTKKDYQPYTKDGQELDPDFNGIEPNAIRFGLCAQHRVDKIFTNAPAFYIDIPDITKLTPTTEYHIFVPDKYVTKHYQAWNDKGMCIAGNVSSMTFKTYKGQQVEQKTITDSLGRTWLRITFSPTETEPPINVHQPTMPVYVTSERELGLIEEV